MSIDELCFWGITLIFNVCMPFASIGSGGSRRSVDTAYITLKDGRRVSMTEYEKNLVEEFKARRGF